MRAITDLNPLQFGTSAVTAIPVRCQRDRTDFKRLKFGRNPTMDCVCHSMGFGDDFYNDESAYKIFKQNNNLDMAQLKIGPGHMTQPKIDLGQV